MQPPKNFSVHKAYVRIYNNARDAIFWHLQLRTRSDVSIYQFQPQVSYLDIIEDLQHLRIRGELSADE